MSVFVTLGKFGQQEIISKQEVFETNGTYGFLKFKNAVTTSKYLVQ
jgi:hypothetical protein